MVFFEVVPIIFDETLPLDEKYLRRMFIRTDGLLVPGGKKLIYLFEFKNFIAYIFTGRDYVRTSHAAKVVHFFMKWGKELVDNNQGYYPILGICMGIELFACYAYDNGKVTFHILR